MISLKVNAEPGSDIKECFATTIRMAQILDCRIEFEFNEINCVSNKHGDAELGVTNFQIALNNGQRFALSYTKPF